MTDGQITRSSEMTNEQIEKALLICYGRAPLDECDCTCCPYVERKHCNDKLMTDVINLIRRQKAEIERLEHTVELLESGVGKE